MRKPISLLATVIWLKSSWQIRKIISNNSRNALKIISAASCADQPRAEVANPPTHENHASTLQKGRFRPISWLDRLISGWMHCLRETQSRNIKEMGLSSLCRFLAKLFKESRLRALVKVKVGKLQIPQAVAALADLTTWRSQDRSKSRTCLM